MNPAAYFGFSAMPFTREISSASLFPSAQYQELQARLRYIAESRLFGVVTGEVGSGKSTAIRAFQDSLDKSRYLFIYLSDSSLRPKDLYRELLFVLGEKPPFLKRDAKRHLDKTLLELFQKHKKQPVIVIDEAHHLEMPMLQELRFLLNFQIDSVSPISLILVGQPELRGTLRLKVLEAVAQRINARFHLAGLDKEETKKYINHQLQAVHARTMLFSEQAIELIYEHTKGISRTINNLCMDCLLDAYGNENAVIDEVNVRRVLADKEMYQ